MSEPRLLVGRRATAAEIAESLDHRDAQLATADAQIAALREALDDALSQNGHAPDCPAREWSGIQPACVCGWAQIEVDGEAALSNSEAIAAKHDEEVVRPWREALEQALDRMETAFVRLQPEMSDEDKEAVAQALWFGTQEADRFLDANEASEPPSE